MNLPVGPLDRDLLQKLTTVLGSEEKATQALLLFIEYLQAKKEGRSELPSIHAHSSVSRDSS